MNDEEVPVGSVFVNGFEQTRSGQSENPPRAVLVVRALEAFTWWPEAAPLTPAERYFVLERLAADLLRRR